MRSARAAAGARRGLLGLFGAVRMQQQRPDDALVLFERQAELSPDAPDGHFNCGMLLLSQGCYHAATVPLERAAAIDPSPETHYLLGVAWRRVGTARAIGAGVARLEAATRLRPEWYEAWFELGRALASAGDEPRAEASFEQALRLRPGDPAALFELAGVMAETGRPAAAVAAYERLLAATDHTDARRERDRILALEASGANRPIARYPRAAGDFDDPAQVLGAHVFAEPAARVAVEPGRPVLVSGSHFGANLGLQLVARGVEAKYIPIPEHYGNPWLYRALFEWLGGAQTPPAERFAEVFGDAARSATRGLLELSSAVIVPLGTAAGFIDDAGQPVSLLGTNLHVALDAPRYRFATAVPSAQVRELRGLCSAVHAINPAAEVVLAISAVPLKATTQSAASMVADCASKSVLRAAVDELFAQAPPPRTSYFPAFEAVRWLGSHIGPVYGSDDGSPIHPDDRLMELIADGFLATYGGAHG